MVAGDPNPNGGEININFHQQVPGEYFMVGGDISINGFGNNLIGVNDNIILTGMEVGEYIKGTISGKVSTITSPGPIYEFHCDFKVKDH